MLHFTLRQLQVFEKVATCLNHSQAARELYLSQPAVSMQIKQLEAHIGLPLFEQMGKKIFLTEAWRELYPYSRHIAQQLAEVEAVFNRLKGLEQGKLSLSVVNTANYFTPQLLAEFCQHHPDIQISLQVANRDAVLKQLDENRTDLAIMGQPPEGLDLNAERFRDNLLVVIAAPTHPLAQLEQVKFSQLAQEPFLLREQGSGTRSAMERLFAKHRTQLRIRMEMETNEANAKQITRILKRLQEQAFQLVQSLGVFGDLGFMLRLDTCLLVPNLHVLPNYVVDFHYCLRLVSVNHYTDLVSYCQGSIHIFELRSPVTPHPGNLLTPSLFRGA